MWLLLIVHLEVLVRDTVKGAQIMYATATKHLQSLKKPVSFLIPPKSSMTSATTPIQKTRAGALWKLLFIHLLSSHSEWDT